MNYKKLSMATGIGVASAYVAGCTPTPTNGAETVKAAKGSKPNIVYILADDLGYAELGCYGQTKILTPNIDRLAKEGIKFSQHYSGSPVCAPSRCTLMTGYHTGHAHVRGNKDNYYRVKGHRPIRTGQEPLPAGTVTVPALLKTAGYKTSVIGKWGLGGFHTTGHPNKMGVDYFFGYLDQWNAHNYYPPFLARNGEKVKLNNPKFPAHQHFPKDKDPKNFENYKRYKGNDFSCDLMIKEALNFIDRNKDDQFFLYFASPIPHVSLQVPDAWLEKYLPKGWDKEPYLGKKGYLPQRYPRACYAAMVSHLDWQVGQIMDKLKKEGLDNNTIVIFTSDNGPTFNGGSDSNFFKSAGPLNGLKCSILEGGIRIPHIARWPGKIKPNTDSDLISGFWDFMPTACDLAGVDAPKGIDGRSYLPTLLGEKQPELQNRVMYWEDARQKQAARKGDWKIVVQHVSMEPQLFNLKNDIGETKDLSKTHPKKFQEMLKLLKTERTPSKEFKLMTKADWTARQKARKKNLHINANQSWFSKALQYKGIVVEDNKWNIWGCSPIQGEDGKTHLFVTRWPERTGHRGWKTHSQIAHYVAENPEGPFKFSNVVLEGTGKNTWDKFSPHNSTIYKVNNKYALFYIANTGLKGHPANQQIGLLTSESLNGPWKKAGKDGLILSPPTDRSYYNYKAGNGVVNPAFIYRDGKYLLYFKSNDTRTKSHWRPKMGLAIADNLEGPYIQRKKPITENNQVIEDGYAFKYKNKVYLVTTDNHGTIEFGGGLIWESQDGINFNPAPKKAFTILRKYLGGKLPKGTYRTKGKAGDKFERPQILMINHKPAYIYMPSGTNVNGGKGSAGYVLKINLNK